MSHRVHQVNTSRSNPFATRYVRPGAVEFQFCDESSAETLVDTLHDQGWNGQIVGPHGSGKTTLLETLIPVCERRGRRVIRYSLHNRQRRCDEAWRDHSRWSHDTLVVVDGFEQLATWWRWRLRAWCRRTRCGLLITTHQAQSWPTLYRTRASLPVLQRLVARLTADRSKNQRPTPRDVRLAFVQHQGDCREALMQLYDVWQQIDGSAPIG